LVNHTVSPFSSFDLVADQAYRASVWSRCSECSPVGIEERKERAMLALIERAQFDAITTNDKKMGAEGQLSRRPFAILILSATSWNLIKPHVGNIADALEAAKPGEVARVDEEETAASHGY
jgi:hypothetical protein